MWPMYGTYIVTLLGLALINRESIPNSIKELLIRKEKLPMIGEHHVKGRGVKQMKSEHS
jgi:hypothetical protein